MANSEGSSSRSSTSSLNDSFESCDLKEQIRQLKVLLSNDHRDCDIDFDKKIEIEILFKDKLFVSDMVSSERFKQEQIDFDVLCKEEDGRISLAYERLPGIPKKVAEKFALKTHILDLSYNNIKDLSFLSNFKTLHTLILDNNVTLNEKTLPFLPSLRILWLNKCEINSLSKWVQRCKICAPNLQQLSLMGNPGIKSTFNGGTQPENNDYIMYVISNIPTLQYLDDVKITDEQRTLVKTQTGAYSVNGSQMEIGEDFSSPSNILTFLKYEARNQQRLRKNGLVVSKLPSRTKPSVKI